MSEFWRRLILMTQKRLGKDMDCTLDLFCANRKETCSFDELYLLPKVSRNIENEKHYCYRYPSLFKFCCLSHQKLISYFTLFQFC